MIGKMMNFKTGIKRAISVYQNKTKINDKSK